MQHRIRRHQCHPIENELDTVREAPVFQTLPLSSGIERLAALYALRMIEGARLQSKLYAQRVRHHDFDVLNLTGLALKDHRPDGMTLGEVPVEGDKREPVPGPERFRAFSLAQALLAREPGQPLLFDEVEGVFGNGFSAFMRELFGRGRNAPTTKGWINETLETNPVPTPWVCNDITAMDPAYLRRFDLVAEFRASTERVRRRIVQRCFPEGTLSRDGIQALTAMESLHLAVKWLRSGRLSLPTTGCCESELNPPASTSRASATFRPSSRRKYSASRTRSTTDPENVTDSLPRPRYSFTTHALHFAVESAVDIDPLVRNGDFNGDLRYWTGGSGISYDSSHNPSGPASGSGVLKITRAVSVGGRVVSTQCVPLPGPAVYHLSAWARTAGTGVGADQALVGWSLVPDDATGTCVGSITRNGEKFVAQGNTWREMQPLAIEVSPAEWSGRSSLAVHLIAQDSGIATGGTPTVVGYFDGIRLSVAGAGGDSIFADGFEP
ncbi:hypothetical protein WB794_12255 [Denitratimonas tolerans]|uniref:CBM-cenC domain-containing protein n=1 Tax=Denitratimonas tolerans TaxID=1338420 RepID=A0AAW9R7V6_9GAMM